MAKNIDGVVDIRKYPNRRYYDTSRSGHVTLEDIYGIVCDGRHIRVTDTKTGGDITAKVLAQIILEHDPPKLEVFPVELLHRLIRSNEQLVRDFVDKYFNQALSAFLASQKQFEQYLRQSVGLHPPAPMGANWVQAMMGPFAEGLFASDRSDGSASAGAADAPGADAAASPQPAELRAELQTLRRQMAALQEQLGQARGPGTDE